MLQQQAQQFTNACLAAIRTRHAEEKHKADTLLATVKSLYEHGNDSNFTMAETRMEAMATQARNRESTSQRHQREDQPKYLHSNDQEWATTLPLHRANKANTPASTSGQDTNAGTRDNSRERNQVISHQPPPSPPQGGAGVTAKGKYNKGKNPRGPKNNPRRSNSPKPSTSRGNQKPNNNNRKRPNPNSNPPSPGQGQLSEEERNLIRALRASKKPKRK